MPRILTTIRWPATAGSSAGKPARFAATPDKRLNINGIIDCNDLSAIVRYDDTINAQSTIKLFQQIELQNPGAERIHILTNSRIELVFLSPYVPNLNLIERFWKFFKKTVLYGRYYETFSQFKTACGNFFAGLDQYRASLRSLLTDRFQIIGRSRLSAKI